MAQRLESTIAENFWALCVACPSKKKFFFEEESGLEKTGCLGSVAMLFQYI